MAAPTIKTPNIVDADKAGIVSDTGTLAFNTETDSLEYINNDLSYVKLNPTSANMADTVVARDGTGNFSVNTITGSLNGNASTSSSTFGNAGTATALQTARTIGGVSFDGNSNIVPETIKSINEASDTTCFPLFISASGSQSLQPLNSTNYTYNALTSNLGIKYLTFSGGSDPSGTETIIDIGSDGSYQDSNYIRIGGGGRNIGVFSGGATFLTFNADYNGSSTDYVYNGSAPAFVIELGVTKGFLRYAPSGIAGNPITIFNALTWNTSGNVDIEKGELSVSTAGKGFSVKGGPNARIGIGATLVGGSVTVNTTAVATGDVILLSCTAAGGVQGFLRISAIVNAVSFTVTSSSALDTSTFSWVIVRPT